jgi:type III pantothenate kinase
MLLAIDISNTNIKIGIYNKTAIEHRWVVSTARQRTTDEYAMLLSDLMRHAGLRFTDVDDIMLSSVVPPLTPVFQELARSYCNKEAIIVDHTLDLGMKLLIDNPWELGSDRIVTALAAHHLYGGPAIIIAFSTATTFDVISVQGDFLGGAIAPGLLISAEALTSAASRLYRVDLTPPRSALGKNTIENLQSGIIYGHVGLVQGLIHRLRREIPGVTEADERQVKVIAHGGLAQLMAPIIPEIQHVNQYLPLEGLRLAYVRLTTS